MHAQVDGITADRADRPRDVCCERVGVVLDAGRPRKLSQVTVTTDTSGFTAEIEAGSSPSGPFTPVAGSQTVNGSAKFSLHGPKARYYVVWITSLGTNSSVHVNEVTAS